MTGRRTTPSVQGRTLNPYEAYNFKDKDPVIDELRTLVEDEFGHRMTRKDLKKIEDQGGPRVGTMEGWFFKTTLRPGSAGVEACGRTLGYLRTWIKMSDRLRAEVAKGTKLKGAKATKPAKYTNGKT